MSKILDRLLSPFQPSLFALPLSQGQMGWEQLCNSGAERNRYPNLLKESECSLITEKYAACSENNLCAAALPKALAD